MFCIEIDQGKPRCIARIQKEYIAVLPVISLMRSIIQLDGAQNRQIARGTKNEVKMLGADLIESARSGLIVESAANGKHVRDTYFAKYLKVFSNRLTENTIERTFCRRK